MLSFDEMITNFILIFFSLNKSLQKYIHFFCFPFCISNTFVLHDFVLFLIKIKK